MKALGNSPIASFLAGICSLYAFAYFGDGEMPGPRHASAEAPDTRLLLEIGASPRAVTLPERREPPRLRREPGEEACHTRVAAPPGPGPDPGPPVDAPGGCGKRVGRPRSVHGAARGQIP